MTADGPDAPCSSCFTPANPSPDKRGPFCHGGRAGARPAVKRGYARVSTSDQSLAAQRDCLAAEGCERIYEDAGTSGAAAERPGLERLRAALEPGDVVVVARLDRLGRSLAQLVTLIEELRGLGVEFRSVRERIDTTDPGGRLYFHLLAALAEFERELIRERTRAGMASAKARGERVGRPAKLTAEMLAHADQEIAAGRAAPATLARELGISRRTLMRHLRVVFDS